MIISDSMFLQMRTFLITQFTKKYDCIIGLKRGGLVPAVYFSHALETPMYVADVTHSLSKGDNLGWHDGALPTIEPGKNILIVDDILDSGYTVEECAKHYLGTCNVDIAVLVTKPSALLKCEQLTPNVYHAMEIPDDSPFVYFPWETKPGE